MEGGIGGRNVFFYRVIFPRGRREGSKGKDLVEIGLRHYYIFHKIFVKYSITKLFSNFFHWGEEGKKNNKAKMSGQVEENNLNVPKKRKNIIFES